MIDQENIIYKAEFPKCYSKTLGTIAGHITGTVESGI